MPTSNPTLSEDTFRQVSNETYPGGVMTAQGTVNKTAFLAILVGICAAVSWNVIAHNPAIGGTLTLAGFVAGFITAIILCFKMKWAPMLAPVYAIFEGFAIGAVSYLYESLYNGIVLQAAMLTFGVLFAMLFLYKTGLIQVTQKFRMMVMAATGGIFLVYLISIVLGFFHIQVPFIHSNGWMGIGFSLFVVGIAALNLVLDFDFIEKGAQHAVPKYMEWYGAFSLMVTIIWLYIEILRLLAKFSRRN